MAASEARHHTKKEDRLNVGVVTYCPPRGLLNSDAFYDNVTKSKMQHPLFLFSDDSRWNPSQLIAWPEFSGRRPGWTINNFVFFKALEIARAAKLDYYIFLESDSRVFGDAWDDVVFSEYFQRYPNGIACAGTMVAWDLCSGGREFAKKVISEAFAFQNATGIPMSFFSSKSPTDCSGAALYVNGSGAVYQTAAMLKIFGMDNPMIDLVTLAKRTTAYDLEIGRRLWNYHGPEAVNHVGWLRKSYSGFGDCIMNYESRKALLLSGQCSIIHQCKDDWTP